MADGHEDSDSETVQRWQYWELGLGSFSGAGIDGGSDIFSHGMYHINESLYLSVSSRAGVGDIFGDSFDQTVRFVGVGMPYGETGSIRLQTYSREVDIFQVGSSEDTAFAYGFHWRNPGEGSSPEFSYGYDNTGDGSIWYLGLAWGDPNGTQFGVKYTDLGDTATNFFVRFNGL